MSRGAAGLVILGAFALFALSSGSEERARQRAEEDRKRAVRNKHIIDTFTPLPGPQKIYTQVQDFPDNPSVTCYTPAFDPPVWCVHAVSSAEGIEFFQFQAHPDFYDEFQMTVVPFMSQPRDLKEAFKLMDHATLKADGRCENRVRYFHADDDMGWFIVRVTGPGDEHWLFEHKSLNRVVRRLSLQPPPRPVAAKQPSYQELFDAHFHAAFDELRRELFERIENITEVLGKWAREETSRPNDLAEMLKEIEVLAGELKQAKERISALTGLSKLQKRELLDLAESSWNQAIQSLKEAYAKRFKDAPRS